MILRQHISLFHFQTIGSVFLVAKKMTDPQPQTPILKHGIQDALRKCQNVLENEVSLVLEDLKYLENSHTQVLEEYAQMSQKVTQLIATQAQESQRTL